ncbi:DUF4383 domain-containing protein [Actinospica robiniae]|uniref:DUF4383 domain-containing protein n=1 Tax=Actinospica robiniae TaxID=304901 RepID=UPI00041FC842|nr:DUF4383 domain-containing protein [Actinospica robiniae]
MQFYDHLPQDHRLGRVYRYGGGFMGLLLLVFGVLGLADQLAFFTTHGEHVLGLTSNGTLSVISIVAAAVLVTGAVIGGNIASTVNFAMGALFVLSGAVNLALLDTQANFLAFRFQNVMFSFVVGVMLVTFGAYGRVSGGLPHDNPYWRARHPEAAEAESAGSAEIEPAAPARTPAGHGAR